MRDFKYRRLLSWGGKIEPLFWLYSLIPLIFLLNNGSASRQLRILNLLAVVCLALCSANIRKRLVKNYQALQPLVKVLLAVILIAAVYSGLRSFQSIDLRLVGYTPEYLGILSWFIFFFVGLLFSHDLKRVILSPKLLWVLLLALVVSLGGDSVYIRDGLRIGGVMFQSTTMALYAAGAAVVALHHLSANKSEKWTARLAATTLVLATATVVLTQSRVGYVALIMVFGVWAVLQYKTRRWLSVVLITLIVCIALLPRISADYFSRFYAASVNKGVDYRLDLYKTSAPDLLRHNLLIGNGASALPRAINNQNQVTEEVAKSLRLGYTFSSTHDLYFDIANFFGCLAALAFVLLTVLGLRHPLKKLKAQPVLALLFLVLILNALFNVPSLELTSLYFVVMFGLLQPDILP